MYVLRTVSYQRVIYPGEKHSGVSVFHDNGTWTSGVHSSRSVQQISPTKHLLLTAGKMDQDNLFIDKGISESVEGPF